MPEVVVLEQPEEPGIPSTFEELFGIADAHRWRGYAAGTWTDVVGGTNGTDGGTNPPEQGTTTTGLTFPSFDDSDNTGLETAGNVSTLDGRTSWTIYGAFKTKGDGAYGGLIDKSGAWYVELSLDGGGTIYVGVSNVSGHEVFGTTPVGDDQLHRFIVTCNSGTLQLYVDGVLDGTDTGVIAVPAVSSPILLGKQASGSTTTQSDVPILGIATRGLSALEVGYLDAIINADVGDVLAVAPVLSSLNYSQGDTLGGGQSIVLTGEGFTGVTSISFGPAPAAFTVDSDTQITATLPSAVIAGIPDFDGTDDKLISTVANNVVFSASASSFFVLFDADSIPTASGADYGDGTFINDTSNAETTIGLTSAGFSACFYAGAYKRVTTVCGTGMHLGQVKHDGTNLYVRIDNGAWQSIACGALSFITPSDVQIGRSYGSLFFDGRILAMGASSAAAFSDSTFDDLLAWAHWEFGIDLGIAASNFDPATLDLSLFFRPANYSATTGAGATSTWIGTASAGSSGGRDLTEPSAALVPAQVSVDKTGMGVGTYNIMVTNPSGSDTTPFDYWDPTQDANTTLVLDALSNPYDDTIGEWVPRYTLIAGMKMVTPAGSPFNAELSGGPSFDGSASNEGPMASNGTDGVSGSGVWRDYLGAYSAANDGRPGTVVSVFRSNMPVTLNIASTPYTNRQSVGNLSQGTLGISSGLDSTTSTVPSVSGHTYNGGSTGTLTVDLSVNGGLPADVGVKYATANLVVGYTAVEVPAAFDTPLCVLNRFDITAESFSNVKIGMGGPYNGASYTPGWQSWAGANSALVVQKVKCSDATITKIHLWAKQRFGVP